MSKMKDDKPTRFYTEFYKSSAFLFSLVIIIFVNPFLDNSAGGSIIGALLVLGTMAGALSVMFNHKYIFWYGMSIVAFSIVLELLSMSYHSEVYVGLKYLRNSFFLRNICLDPVLLPDESSTIVIDRNWKCHQYLFAGWPVIRKFILLYCPK